jgi:hypothetical protein
MAASFLPVERPKAAAPRRASSPTPLWRPTRERRRRRRPRGLSPTRAFHLNVRILPFDDALERSTRDDQLSWDWIFENVFGFWDIQNPIMARRSGPVINLPLHDRAVVEAMTGVTGRSPAARLESARKYAGDVGCVGSKRRLLHRWCGLVDVGEAPQRRVVALGLKPQTNDPRVLGMASAPQKDLV